MNKKAGIILLLVFFLIFVWFLWRVINPHIDNQFKRSASIGMLSAVRSDFEAELKKSESTIHQTLEGVNSGLVLNSKQYDAVIIELAKYYNLDPPIKWDTTEPLLDPWDNRLVIWCRKLPDGRYVTQVTSKGRDGLLDTADDIQYGERPE